MSRIWPSATLSLGLYLALSGCARKPPPGGAPGAAAEFAALPDTLVCVVDRTTERGLRNLTAKRGPGGEALLQLAGEVRPLEEVHPVHLMAGYAGREPWLTAAEPVPVRGVRYVPVQGERRIPLEKLSRVAEHNSIPLFADPADDPPPDAVYVPTRPGCIFQPYVREELMRR